MKKIIRVLCLLFCAFSFLTFSFTKANAEENNDKIYLGGMPVGFSFYSKGAYILGLSDIITENGIISPAKDVGIKVGDYILSINGESVNCAKDIENVVKDGNSKIIGIKRNSETFFTTIKPEKDITGNYKLGVYIRDELNGIGTVTFIKGYKIATLGHPVIENDNSIMEIVGGKIYKSEVTGYISGEKGKAGELKGIIDKNACIGNIENNCIFGVYGDLYKSFDGLKEIDVGTAEIGNASIYTTINGDEPKEYSISIIKNDNCFSKDKTYVIKITDKRLLNTTGGIVQGMSGSPIIQNEKLVGAVTHVFINDPTRGFGLSIDKMLNNL